MTLSQLKKKLERLSPAGIRFVARVVDSMSMPPRVSIHRDTWITTSEEWIDYFGLALSVHHGTTSEPLRTTGFENVFRNACESVNWVISPHGSMTQRFVDITVQSSNREKRRISLKSTAAKNLSETRVHISKLTEAAWIQDVRSAQTRRDAIRNLFQEYLDAVDIIIVLRAFRNNEGAIQRYQLVEIPSEIFASILNQSSDTFKSEAPIIDCDVDGRTIARVAIDRSDAKITVRSILLDVCTVHAEWVREWN